MDLSDTGGEKTCNQSYIGYPVERKILEGIYTIKNV
jgi:hypothetical protein